ncbi:MAG: tetratricopeptide repeat protein [Bacteroidetes bacterium]|nr:tetratricopeptide repeat protein [Bacteroidota bacterium]
MKNVIVIFFCLIVSVGTSNTNPYNFKGHSDTGLVTYTIKAIDEIQNDKLSEALNNHLYNYCKLMIPKVDSVKARVFYLGLANSINNKGYYCDINSNYNEAFNFYNEALLICNKHAFYSLAGDCLLNLGNVCQEQGNYTAAKLYYKNSVLNLLKVNNRLHAAIVVNNLASLTYRTNQHALSIQYLEKAISLIKSVNGNNANCVDELIHIAKNQRSLSRSALYKQYIYQAYTESIKLNIPFYIARATIAKGIYHVDVLELDSAKKSIITSKKMCSEIKSTFLNEELINLQKKYDVALNDKLNNMLLNSNKKNKQNSELIF